MQYDAFVYYTHFDCHLGQKVVQLLEENGLTCWDDKRDTRGLGKVKEVLSSSRSYIIVGDNDGGSTYRSYLMGEILQMRYCTLQSRNHLPIFFICSPWCKSEISKDGNYTPVSIFSYDDPNYIIDKNKNSRHTFSDYSSYEAHLEEVSLKSASLFDKDRFSLYIKETIIKEIKNIVLYEVPRVFISHSHLDNDVANEIYNSLSRSGVKCWMDLKDIPAGASYSDAIIQGLEWCNCLVLIYSKNVIGSADIPNELEVAHTDHKTIIPFLIDDSPIEGGYRYYLPRKQWIDASQQRHIAIEKLKSELFRNTPERLDINHSDSPTPSIAWKIRCFFGCKK